MLKAWCSTFACLSILVALPAPASAQEVIHALTGTVTAINKAVGTISVFQDNGKTDTFQVKTDSKTRISFDKKIAADTTAATAFEQKDAYVIVFYFGQDDHTVVALKGLGAGPFTAMAGTVEKFDNHHAVTIKDKAGALQTFAIGPGTVAESYLGVVDGAHLDMHKGDRIRVVAAEVNGSPAALFVGAN